MPGESDDTGLVASLTCGYGPDSRRFTLFDVSNILRESNRQ